MKKLLLLSFLSTTLFCHATDYWSISTTLWSNTDGGADCSCSPGNLNTGDNVYVKHFISSAVMTLSGTPSVLIFNGGRWDLTGGNMDINAGSWTINSGGTLAVKGGTLTSGGFTTFLVNGKLELVDLINNGAITGSGLISYTGSITNNATIDPLSTLPVELIDFSVSTNSNSVDVKWSTASEINSDYYTVMRSKDAVHFESVGTIQASENSASMIIYNFTDHSPLPGITYYQLIETDKDGSTQQSKVTALDFNATSNLIIHSYSNPVEEEAQLFFPSSAEGMFKINISNAYGLSVYSASGVALSGENKLFLSMHEYSGGLYLITLTDADERTSTVRIVKK